MQCGERVLWCARVGQRGTIDDRGPVTDVLAVGATSGYVYTRDKRRRPDGEQLLDVSVPAEYRTRAGETFTLRLDRATREFYYIVRGRVSPAQFTDLADGPLEFVAFPLCCDPPSTIVDVRVDAASAAAGAPRARGTTDCRRRGMRGWRWCGAALCAALPAWTVDGVRRLISQHLRLPSVSSQQRARPSTLTLRHLIG